MQKKLFSVNLVSGRSGNNGLELAQFVRRSLPLRAVSAVFGSLLVAGAVYGQDATPAAVATGADAETASGLSEVVVTAEKRTEDISKAPVAVAAVSGQQLKDADVVNAVQLQYLAPSTIVTQTQQGVYVNIRGVTTTDRTSKSDPAVLFNVDGVPVGDAVETAIPLFDVQRVEVLSGPQGTLYGKSSTGGSINVVTNAPVPQEDAAVTAELGNYNTKRVNAMINAPLGDDWAIRVAGTGNYRDGYVNLIGSGGALYNPNQRLDDENSLAGRVSLAGKITDNVQLRVTGTLGKIGGSGFGNGMTSLDVNSGGYGSGTLVAAWNQFQSYIRDDFQKINAQLTADMGPVRLTYIGEYGDYHSVVQQGNSYFGALGAGSNAASGARSIGYDYYKSNYQELRFSNSEAGRIDWVAGLNYETLDVDEGGHQFLVASGPTLATFQANGWNPLYQNAKDLVDTTDHTSYGVFAHGRYEITPEWHATLGVRESVDKISRVGSVATGAFMPGTTTPWPDANGAPCVNGENCIGVPDTGTEKNNKFVWNVGTDYQFTPNQMGYMTIATGYKAGGFNDYLPGVSAFGPYAPESMTAYELGYKLFMAPRVSYTASLYYYDYSNMQQSANLLIAGQNTLYTFGTSTRLYGMENTLRWAATDSDVVEAELDLEKSRFENLHFLASNKVTLNATGQSLDLTPAAVLTLGLTHTFPLGNGGKLELHGDSHLSTDYLVSNFALAERFHQNRYSRSNARLGYLSPSGKLSTELFVTNIENKVQIMGLPSFYAAGTVFPTGYSALAFGQVSQPRFYGIRETVNF